MILYTLGTTGYPFDRAIKWLQELLKKEIIVESVLLQHGVTSVANLSHPLLTSVVGLNRNEMHEAVKNASLVISHAGQGSTRMLADMGARFVLLPRLKCYGEHVDDHQLLFARTVEKLGVRYCTELNQLIGSIVNPPFSFQGKLLEDRFLVEHLIAQYNESLASSH